MCVKRVGHAAFVSRLCHDTPYSVKPLPSTTAGIIHTHLTGTPSHVNPNSHDPDSMLNPGWKLPEN